MMSVTGEGIGYVGSDGERAAADRITADPPGSAMAARRAFAAVLRTDLASFVRKAFATLGPTHPFRPNWHIHAMAWHLQRCAEGEIKRLIITLPPRGLKSISASVALPAWVLGRDPSRRIICASYSAELAAKHARDCKAIIAADWYMRLFPRTRIKASKSADLDFETTRRGYRLSTSVGGTLTGRGGNLIIIDDPIKPSDAGSQAVRRSVKDRFDGTLYSRLDSKADDVIVLIMQRLHVDDLVAHVLEKEVWVHLDLPAIAEVEQTIEVGPGRFHYRRFGEVLHAEREPRAVLDRIKGALGTYNFSAQYQQCPVPPGGNLIKWEWFNRYRDLPARQVGDWIVQSWDTAMTANQLSDYSVCTTWLVRDADLYLIDVVRERLEYPYLKKRIIAEWKRHRATVLLIENKGSGTSLIQDLRQEGIRPIGFKPEGDKELRMSAQSAKIEAGCVFLPERAAWLEDFRAEMMQFPEGRYDDQIDSMAQFLIWQERHRHRSPRMFKLRGL